MKKRVLRRIISSPFDNYCIRSYGIILYCINTKKWLMVKRKDSVEYVLLMKGRYEKSEILMLMRGLTKDEIFKVKIMLDDPKYFVTESMRTCEKYKNYSYQTFQDSIKLIRKAIEKLEQSNYNFHQLNWEWPKGMINKGENEFSCAQRELEEETGISLDNNDTSDIIRLSPQRHCYVNKTIEVTFWFVTIHDEIPMTPPSSSDLEVSDRRWFTSDQVERILDGYIYRHRADVIHNEPSIVHHSNMYKNLFNNCLNYLDILEKSSDSEEYCTDIDSDSINNCEDIDNGELESETNNLNAPSNCEIH